MTDIVERLREYEHPDEVIVCRMREAANEIERLRAERDALRDRILAALDAISDGDEAGAHLILYEGKRQINAARKS